MDIYTKILYLCAAILFVITGLLWSIQFWIFGAMFAWMGCSLWFAAWWSKRPFQIEARGPWYYGDGLSPQYPLEDQKMNPYA